MLLLNQRPQINRTVHTSMYAPAGAGVLWFRGLVVGCYIYGEPTNFLYNFLKDFLRFSQDLLQTNGYKHSIYIFFPNSLSFLIPLIKNVFFVYLFPVDICVDCVGLHCCHWPWWDKKDGWWCVCVRVHACVRVCTYMCVWCFHFLSKQNPQEVSWNTHRKVCSAKGMNADLSLV